ncbi:unnamed protein product, partial [Pylaiella littoralis]
MEDLEETSRLVFHGVAHVLTTSVVAGSTLRVEVETEDGKSRWCGEFPARYVEGITQKTGSAKKFPVFVKMLLAALVHGSSDSVFVDLLTYADLELLKARRVSSAHHQQQQQQAGGLGGGGGPGRANTSAANGSSTGNNKRYLILTYAAEFDRVHYPLPLAFVEVPEREQLERTIDRLREDLSRRSLEGAAQAKNNSGSDLSRGSSAQLVAENTELRRQMEALAARRERSEPPPLSSSSVRRGTDDEEFGEAGGGGGGGGAGGGPKLRRLRQAYEELQTQLDDLREAHERLRLDSASEIRKLRRDAREGAKAVEMAASTAGEAENQAAALREELEDSERELKEAQEKHRRQIDSLNQDLAKERVNSRALRAKIREVSARRGPTAPDPRAYGQQQQPYQQQRGRRRFTSPLGGGVGRSRSAGSSRRLGESLSTTHRRGALTATTATNTYTNTGGGLTFGRGRQRRADSPRHAPLARGRGSSSKPSSRGSSIASSRGRSRSRSAGSRKGVTPVFDPTAYQKDREARLQRLQRDRRRRERGEIGYSPSRNSGRDSWMGSSGDRGAGSSAAGGLAPRGRSAVRDGDGGRRSGYASAGSQASRASRGSSTRSRLSLSAQSDDASSTSRSRYRRRRATAAAAAAAATTPSKTKRNTRRPPSPSLTRRTLSSAADAAAAAAARNGRGRPSVASPASAASSTRSSGNGGGGGGGGGGAGNGGSGGGRKYSASGRFEPAAAVANAATGVRRARAGSSSRLRNSCGGPVDGGGGRGEG